MTIIGTALSGMQASQARLTASASNVAHSNDTGSIAGPISAPATFGPIGKAEEAPSLYKPLRVEQSSLASGAVTTRTTSIGQSYTMRYQPDSLAADSQGMVATPNVDLTQEAVEQLAALQDFKANAKVIQTMDAVTGSTLEIWA